MTKYKETAMESQKQLLNEFLNEWNKGEGITVRTSGSTGTPKEIVLPHSQLLRSAHRSINFFGITRRSRLHSAMSFKFIGGKMMIARSLVSGCTLTYSEPAVELVPIKGKQPVDLICLVPAQFPHILDNIESYRNIKSFLVGGSAIDDRLWDRIVSSGLNVWESYGMTETATHVAMRRVCNEAYRRPRFVPLPGVEISTGFDDAILIRDAETFVSTTDIGKIYPDKSFEIIGRKDDVIITGGLKVFPMELESKLAPYISSFVQSFYVSWVPDMVWTSRLVLVMVPSVEQSEEDIKTAVMKSLSDVPEDVVPHKLLPKEIRIVSSLPRTESGKLNRRFKWNEK